MKKRGQMKMSFGMIFSIILIVIFISFAFFAIGKFLDMQKTMQIGKFYDRLQDDVDRMQKSQTGSQKVEYTLPKKAEYVCFLDNNEDSKGEHKELSFDLEFYTYGGTNLVLYPTIYGDLTSVEIENINIKEITKNDNPKCFDVAEGKVEFSVEKKTVRDSLVVIE